MRPTDSERLARLEEKVTRSIEDRRQMHGELLEANRKLDALQTWADQAKGGWKMLLIVVGFLGAMAGAVTHWFLGK